MKRLCSLALVLSLLILSPHPLHADDRSEAAARRLFNALGCKGCHQFEGDGGSLAPPLDQIGSRKTRQQIKDHLVAHGENRKSAFMPSYSTTSQADLELLSDFLYSHKAN